MVYLFYHWLKKHDLPLNDFTIVQYEADYEQTIYHNEEWIENSLNGNCENSPESSTHFSWIYNGEEWDGNGPIDDEMLEDFVREELTALRSDRVDLIDEFCTQALVNSDWNFFFSRDEAIDYILDTMDINLNHVRYENEYA